MAFLYSGPGGNCLAVALQIDSQVSSALAQTLQWRTAVNGTGDVLSTQGETVYQTLLALKSYVDARKATPGLAEVYQLLFPTVPDFDPDAQWVAARAAIDNFATWFQNNWPDKSAGGKFAFVGTNAGGEFTSFTITLSAPARASLVSRLDAVMAAFATP